MVLELKSLFINAFLQFLEKSGESTCHWWYMYEFQNMNIYVNNNISCNLKDLSHPLSAGKTTIGSHLSLTCSLVVSILKSLINNRIICFFIYNEEANNLRGKIS